MTETKNISWRRSSPPQPLAEAGNRGAVRPLLFGFIGFLCLLVLLLVVAPSLFRPEKKKNILLFVADALRADRLGCYGFDRETSPNIDRLAAGGVLFENYSTVVPTTLASFTSLFTSNYPKDHGASRNLTSPFDDLATLAGAFRDDGYETAAFISSYCLNSKFGLSRGFEIYDETLEQTTSLPDNSTVRTAGHVTDSFLHWLNSRDGDRPFFAVVHYFDPHFPYDPPEQYIGSVTTRRPKKTRGTMKDVGRAMSVLRESGGRPAEWIKDLHDLYCAEIRYMDDEIGRIAGRFRPGGPAGPEGEGEADTILLFTADHGETFWDHSDYFNHGLRVYETTTRIPLVINCPGLFPAGGVSRAALSNIDLAPALCRIAGIPVPASFRGGGAECRMAALTLDGRADGGGDGGKDRLRFAEATMPYHAEKNARRPNYQKAKSVRRGPWKYVEVPYLKGGGELYNLDDDPGELENLAGVPDYASIVDALRVELWRWADDFDQRSGRSLQINKEDADKVKQIGY